MSEPKKYKRSADQTKILKALNLVYPRLVEFKKKTNTELVIMKDGKIVYGKPEDL